MRSNPLALLVISLETLGCGDVGRGARGDGWVRRGGVGDGSRRGECDSAECDPAERDPAERDPAERDPAERDPAERPHGSVARAGYARRATGSRRGGSFVANVRAICRGLRVRSASVARGHSGPTSRGVVHAEVYVASSDSRRPGPRVLSTRQGNGGSLPASRPGRTGMVRRSGSRCAPRTMQSSTCRRSSGSTIHERRGPSGEPLRADAVPAVLRVCSERRPCSRRDAGLRRGARGAERPRGLRHHRAARVVRPGV